MNIYLRACLPTFFLGLLLFTLNACASQANIDKGVSKEKLCSMAKYGELEASAFNFKNKKTNSFIFHCLMDINIGAPMPTSGKTDTSVSRNDKSIRKMQLAEQLLQAEIDVSTRNKFGDTTLMALIYAFFPDAWQAKMAKKLIAEGTDLSAKNMDGDTALTLATRKNNQEFIDIINTPQ
ncbi:MAG: hypothetical protein COA42_09980 [Alteromonadaceae bacterium]|nr:MAG: hypothetical protein COA42_09980 [Alteromonadaceae bacterium]